MKNTYIARSQGERLQIEVLENLEALNEKMEKILGFIEIFSQPRFVLNAEIKDLEESFEIQQTTVQEVEKPKPKRGKKEVK